MKVSIEWLKEYVDVNISPEEYAHAMTMSGSKVESIHYANAEIKGVVAGRVLSISKHPSGEKLSVAVIDAGRPGEVIKVVTGASNVKAGDTVPVALDGASLPGGKQISGTIFRGVESAGMLCSLKELGLDPEDYNEAVEDGIFILNDAGITAVPGADIIQVLSIGDEDVVIEFEITPNRPDCLCMIGIARETAATLGGNNTADKCESSDESSNAGGRKLRWPDLKPQETGIIPASECAKVEILAPDLCPRYAARIIKDVVIKPSPSWMKKRLKAAGVRSINNIVDITNYVMFELGQPMHAFDLDKLEDRQIIVRRAGEGEVMATLDGQDRKLDPS
ncbi:MAG: phenylalanine--tRNA ligase subunit beta, partial [Clostridiales bacterium]|nr:phenylalanine--tRNA ligase subunit beta [Clostridiales bacterium]